MNPTDLGEAAKKLVYELSLATPDRRGVMEESVLARAKKEVAAGNMTSKEYNYIKSLF